MKTIGFHYVWFFLILGMGCSSGTPQAQTSSTLQSSTMNQYQYADGAGNTHTITRNDDRIIYTYSPIKPETSSSGYYDGGTAKEMEITSGQWDAISEEMDRALEASTPMTGGRSMGTGLVIAWENPGGTPTQKGILSMGSAAKSDLEKALEQLK